LLSFSESVNIFFKMLSVEFSA